MTPTTTLESIKEKQLKQAEYIAQLDLWAAVQEQGIAIDSVDTFGFEPKWMTRIERCQRLNAQRKFMPNPFDGPMLANGHCTCTVYNYVKHKDGTITRLRPTLRAP